MEQTAKVGPTVISILIPSHVTDMLSTIYSKVIYARRAYKKHPAKQLQNDSSTYISISAEYLGRVVSSA